MFVTWKLRARPRRLIRYGGDPAISSPSRRIDPLVGAQAAADQVEQRRLAGAVRTDDRMALAAPDVERDAADDRRRAEAHMHVQELQRGTVVAPARAPCPCSSRAPVTADDERARASSPARSHAAAIRRQVRRKATKPPTSSTDAPIQGQGDGGIHRHPQEPHASIPAPAAWTRR